MVREHFESQTLESMSIREISFDQNGKKYLLENNRGLVNHAAGFSHIYIRMRLDEP
jgi:hypothetical protein